MKPACRTSDNRRLAKIIRTGKMPIPQEKITLVGWASCPSHQLRKRIFARGLMENRQKTQ